MTTFRFNGFNITILSDKVIASDANTTFTFKTLEDALETLGNA
jgi:hypothetical protein